MDLQLRIVGWLIGKAGYTTFYGAFPFAVVAVAGSDPPVGTLYRPVNFP